MHPYIHIFGVQYPSYTFIMIIGVVFSFIMLYIEARRQNIVTYNTLHWFWFYTLIGIGLGLRLFGYLFFSSDEVFFQTASETSVLGGICILLLVDSVVYYSTQVQLTMYLVSPVLLLHCFGKFACFMGGCCYGTQVSSDCYLGIDASNTFSSLQEGYVHPTQLYELTAFMILFFVVQYCRPNLQPLYEKRAIFLLYIVLYSIVRVSVEFLRGDAHPAFWGLTIGQVIALFLGMVAVVQIILRLKKI